MLAILSGCRTEQQEVHFHVLRSPVFAIQSTRALQHFFSVAHPEYRVQLHIHPNRDKMLTALYNNNDSFAVLDAASAFYIRDAATDRRAGLRSLFPLYYNFLHILIDVNRLIDEERPQLKRPLAFYDSQLHSDLLQIGERIFPTSAVDTEVILDIDADIVDRLQREEISAIMFFDAAPSPFVSASSEFYAGVRLLPLTSDLAAAISESTPYLSSDLLPITDYPGLINSEPILSLQIPVILLTDVTTDLRLVAALCQVFIQNMEEYRTLYPQLESLSLTNSDQALGVPRHIGASACAL